MESLPFTYETKGLVHSLVKRNDFVAMYQSEFMFGKQYPIGFEVFVIRVQRSGIKNLKNGKLLKLRDKELIPCSSIFGTKAFFAKTKEEAEFLFYYLTLNEEKKELKPRFIELLFKGSGKRFDKMRKPNKDVRQYKQEFDPDSF